MDIKRMRCFLILAEEKHFGRAAARLNIVQPALSMQIKTLEDELGGQLFLRNNRQVELTEAGLLLLADAKNILEQLENAELNVRRALRGEIGRVRIGFMGNVVFSGKLGEDMRNFHRQYPEAELVLEELLPQIQIERLLKGQLDIGYCLQVEVPRDSSLLCTPVGEWESVVLMSSEHRLTAKQMIRHQDLSNETMILYSKKEDEGQLRSLFRSGMGFEPAAFLISTSMLTTINYIMAGLGIAVVPLSMRALCIPGLAIRPLEKNANNIALVMVHRKHEAGSAVRAYIRQAESARASN